MSSAAACPRLPGTAHSRRDLPAHGLFYMTTHSCNVLHSWARVFVRAALIATTIAGSAMPAQAQLTATDLADATLDDLMRLSVTTASRTAESLLDAPARMQVITD